MHADEQDIDAALVRRLVATRFPEWMDLPIELVQSVATNNAIYRLGDETAVRLPRIPSANRRGRTGASLAAATPSTAPRKAAVAASV